MSCNLTYVVLRCVPVLQPVKLNISHLQNASDKQSLMVSWLVNHSDLVQGIYEIQISRTENHTIIYNVSIECSAVFNCIPVIVVLIVLLLTFAMLLLLECKYYISSVC